MRILHIGQHHEQVGGAEVLREQAIEALEARGHHNAFFGGSERTSLKEAGRHVVRRAAYDPELLVRDGRFQLELATCIANHRPEVLHLHQIGGLPIDLYPQLAETGIPIVETVYDYGHFCPNSWSVRGDGSPCESGAGAECFRHRCHLNYPFHAGTVWTTARRLQYLQDYVDVVVCPTEDLARRFRDRGLSEARVQSYHPSIADLAPLPPEERVPGRFVVVARLVREKGVDHALRGFALFARTRPDAELHVLGDGPERRSLARLAKQLGIGQRVRFLGHCDLSAAHEQMRRAQALLVPSVWMEALPLVTFDADALGLPIVAHAIGGLPQAVDPGRNGLLVTPGHPEAFAAAMGEIVKSPESFAHFCSHGPTRVARLDIDDYVGGLEAAYRRSIEVAAMRPERERSLAEVDERVLLDRVIRHAGGMEKALISRDRGLSGRLRRGRKKAIRSLRAALERWRRPAPQPRPTLARPETPPRSPEIERREA